MPDGGQGQQHSHAGERSGCGLNRRNFLFTGAAAGGGLLVGVSRAQGRRRGHTAQFTTSIYTLTAWVSVGTDGSVTILCGSQDMGQGIYSGLAQIVAEELRCEWSQVGTGPAPVNAVYDNPLLGGEFTAASSSVRGFFPSLLEAGAIARQMLITAGAAVLGVSPNACIGQAGYVVDTQTGASVSYGSVAQAASMLPPPQSAPLYSQNGYVLVGLSVPRTDIPAKVTGATVYGLDVVVPGMLYGAVLLCPTRGGTVASIGKAPSGCQIVNLGTGIAAVADAGPNCTTWAAMNAVKQVKVKWTVPANAAQQTSKEITSEAISLLTNGNAIVAQTLGNVQQAQANAAKVLTLTYILPYLPHTTMEPPNCTASVTENACEIWAPTQAPASAQATAASITGLPLSAVTVNSMPMGGGLGRKLETDFVAYAVMASKAVGAPVQMVFPREQDLTQDQYRPMAACRITIGITAGQIVSWDFRNVSPSILYQRGLITNGQLDDQATEGATGLPYNFPNLLMDWVMHPATIPVGFWRSVGHSINAFAGECAINEAALACKTDALQFRLNLLAGDMRAQNVLNTAAALGGWGTNQQGYARGLAYHEAFGSLAAVVVTITEVSGAIQVINVACAVDCGFIINPDSATQQIQGAIVQGMSSALWGQMLFKKGVAQSSNFDQYRLALMADMPTVSVTVLQTANAAIGGIGEVGVPCIAPALANAWAALTHKRLRTLPLFPNA